MKIIIYGANEIASCLAVEFFEDHDVIIIDSNKKELEIFERLDVGVIQADAFDIKILKDADISDADVFVACSNNDEANIIACLMAKEITNTQTICFVQKQETMDSLNTLKDTYKASWVQAIENVIWPQKFLVQEIFRIITIPRAVDVENFAHGRAKLLEYRIDEESELLNKQVKDCNFNPEVLVAGIVRDDELFIPTGNSEFLLNDKAILIGTPVGLDIMASSLYDKKGKVKKVTIIGGGLVGYELAKNLEQTSMKVKLIENNYERCEMLSQNLKKTLVLNGSGTSLELLQEEDTSRSDVVVAVTNNDEKNLLCSLLSKQLGATKVLTRVSQNTTANLFEKVGVDVALSQTEACVNEIKNRIIDSRSGVIATVERGKGEVIRIELNKKFEAKKLMEIKTPAPCVIAIIQRGSKVIIPKGQTMIKPLDKLLVFTKADDIFKIRECFN